MDELEFRRAVYADPQSDDPRIKEAAQRDPKKMSFLQELKQLDADLKQASKVEVPEDLASKLIWQGTLSDFEAHKRKSRMHLALAASVAFVVGISFTVWQQQRHTIDFSHEALAHMYHSEIPPGASASTVSLSDINAKLATFGGTLLSDLGTVKAANYCHLDNVRSLHLILDTAQGLVSVFVLPQMDNGSFEPAFADSQFSGEKLPISKANVLVVGEKGKDISTVKQQVQQRMVFSA
ncbi:DUF3379 family protein [Alteromonas sp. SM 2104]|nr:DUF3379 family protein [Alteromonas oceanisediminis]